LAQVSSGQDTSIVGNQVVSRNLSGVGRIVDEVDVEEDWAVRLDGWIAWEAEERGKA